MNFRFNGSEETHEWIKVGDDIVGQSDDDESGYAIDLLEYELDIYIGVGAPEDEYTSGTAAVFRLDRGTQKWHQLGNRYVDGDVEGTNLGRSVSLAHDGKYLLFAVGFPGPGKDATSRIKSGVEVYSITYDGVWDYYGEMIFPKEQYDNTGFKVSLSLNGQTLAISSPQYGRAKGLVRVYKYDKTNPDSPYQQFGNDMFGKEDGDEFGYSLALSRDGNRLIVGAPETFAVSTFVTVDSWAGSVCISKFFYSLLQFFLIRIHLTLSIHNIYYIYIIYIYFIP